MYTVSFIGSGNVAFRLSIALQRAGHKIECICSRNIENALQVVRAVKRHKGNPFATTDYTQVPSSDIIIIAVSDNAIGDVARELLNKRGSLVVHTSGAESMETLKNAGLERCGVLYPLMTLSKNKDLDIRMIPFLLEASCPEDEKILAEVVNSLRAEYKVCDSQKRLQMHTAAVFSTNFINYLLGLSYDVAYPDFTFLLPCAIETVRKAFLNKPSVSQTGPAVRDDRQTIDKHLRLLESCGLTEQYEVYRALTDNIMKRYASKINNTTDE